ncbi:phage minor head protein [Natronococcus sp.]|uniref:phage minor head protein n=1 Tax=Natronococcus sp. TaxID=35747 RepID=UPI003A4DB543
MAGFVDLERIAVRADRALSRLDREQTRELAEYLTRVYRQVLNSARPAYARAMADVGGTASNAAFRLARARVLADEIDGVLQALVAEPGGALAGLNARAAAAREQARGFVEDTLRVFGDAVTISTPVNHRALSGVVEHAHTRLYRHADEVVDRIKGDVIAGLTRGDSWTQVTRAIRENTGYLRSRAEMIAITELHSAQADARQELYADLGVELVIRYVTIDDRTCEYCGPRQGEVTRMSETTEVLHPRCRCILAPFDPEWALDGTLVIEQLEGMRAENLRELKALGLRPNPNAAPFERVRDREGVRVGPAGRGRPTPVWRPGQPVSRLRPWVGRAFGTQ